MSAIKSEMRAMLLMMLCVACLLLSSAAEASSADASSHVETQDCPSDRVAAECTKCSRGSSDDGFIARCCSDVDTYSTCRDQLDTAAVQSKSVAKRSIHDAQLFDDDKRRTPFLGKRRVNPFLGKRRVNPFLGKRRNRNPFLGKRTSEDFDELAEKRRMPFLG